MKTERTSNLPLFHTHVIGSLPRPRLVLDLIARRDEMDSTEYKRAMDAMVMFAIQLQEQAGLDVISDGEWRRTQYIQEYLNRVGGFDKCRLCRGCTVPGSEYRSCDQIRASQPVPDCDPLLA